MVDSVYPVPLESAILDKFKGLPSPAADPGNIKSLHQRTQKPQDLDSVTTHAWIIDALGSQSSKHINPRARRRSYDSV
jgi:hypothetical protein